MRANWQARFSGIEPGQVNHGRPAAFSTARSTPQKKRPEHQDAWCFEMSVDNFRFSMIEWLVGFDLAFERFVAHLDFDIDTQRNRNRQFFIVKHVGR